MNIRSRILRVAKSILSDLNFFTLEQLQDYSEDHKIRPDTKVYVDGVLVPNPNQGKNQDGKFDEQNIIDRMTREQKKLHEVSIFGNEDDRCDIACCGGVHPYTLHLLSNDKDELIRRCVAGNPKTSPKTLKKLSEDKDKDVREYVAHNPNTPSKILKKLSEDNDENVSSAAKETMLTHKKSMKK